MKLQKPVILRESSAPSTPPSGHVVLYSVDGSALLMKDDAGTVVTMGGGTAISGLTTASALDGTELLPVVQGGTTKKTTIADVRVIDVVKPLTANVTSTSATGAALSDWTTSLTAGTYGIRAWLVWQSTATGTGAGWYVDCTGGTVTVCAGHVYTTTTGTTATTGVADQATVAATFQTVESRAWRANATNPGAFGGVDTANADQFAMLECALVVTATTSMRIMHFSETGGTGISTRVGSFMTVTRGA